MLNQKVWIYAVSAGSPHAFNLYFQDPFKAPYLQTGDVITDSAASEFAVAGWEGEPADFVDGGVAYAAGPNTPAEDSDYASTLGTPGQRTYRPALSTSGELSAVAPVSLANYEYSVSLTCDDTEAAALVALGDRVVDQSGKEFTVTYLSELLCSDAIRISESIREGTYPLEGPATLYRATAKVGLYQGAFTPGWEEATRQTIARVDEAVGGSMLDGVDGGVF
jgi:hypothetical protein